MAMTKQQLFARLLKLAQLPHRDGSGAHPWTSADLVSQESLYAIQGEVLAILLDVATDAGPAAKLRLVAALPWAFTTTTNQEA